MQTQKANWQQWVILVVVAVLAVWVFLNIPGSSDVPTAEEIAAEINIPAYPNVTVPTAEQIAINVKVPTLKNDNLDDVLEGVYPDLVEEIVKQCSHDLWNEFNDDAEDEIRDLLETDCDCDIKDVNIEDYDWDDDFDYTIVNLGLDHEEDRAVDFETTLRVSYKEVFGNNDKLYAKVYASASCDDYDDNDEEFDDLSVSYELA